MQFKSPFFTFNGKSCRDFQLRICRVGDGANTSIFGLNRSFEYNESNPLIRTIKNTKYNDTTIEITLVKAKNNIPLPLTKEEKFEIISWLFQEDYKPFISEDDESKIYFAIFTQGNSYQNALEQGYINLTMHLNAACAFSPIETGFFNVRGEYFIDLINHSNVGVYCEPDLEIKLLENTTSFEIVNLNTGDRMSFKDLPKGTHLQLYNESMKQMICVNDPDLNLRKYIQDKDWLRLARGLNRLYIKTEAAQVAIVGQSKIALS